MIEVVNRQRRRKIDRTRWCKFGEDAIRVIGTSDQNATIVFVSNEVIRKLNRDFRAKNVATDVLSFPAEQAEFEKAEGCAWVT